MLQGVCALLAATTASVRAEGYRFSLSASVTDPWINTAAPGPALRSVYLWLTCTDNTAGLGAVTIGLSSTRQIYGFTALNGTISLGGPDSVALIVPDCPTGAGLAELLGFWTVHEAGIGGSYGATSMEATNCTGEDEPVEPFLYGLATDGSAPPTLGGGDCQSDDGGEGDKWRGYTGWQTLSETGEGGFNGVRAEIPIAMPRALAKRVSMWVSLGTCEKLTHDLMWIQGGWGWDAGAGQPAAYAEFKKVGAGLEDGSAVKQSQYAWAGADWTYRVVRFADTYHVFVDDGTVPIVPLLSQPATWFGSEAPLWCGCAFAAELHSPSDYFPGGPNLTDAITVAACSLSTAQSGALPAFQALSTRTLVSYTTVTSGEKTDVSGDTFSLYDTRPDLKVTSVGERRWHVRE
jgi:hypothetical protein